MANAETQFVKGNVLKQKLSEKRLKCFVVSGFSFLFFAEVSGPL